MERPRGRHRARPSQLRDARAVASARSARLAPQSDTAGDHVAARARCPASRRSASVRGRCPPTGLRPLRSSSRTGAPNRECPPGVAERRQVRLHHRQAVVKVPPKRPSTHLLPEIAVRRCDHANVEPLCLAAAERRYLSGLQHAEELRLQAAADRRSRRGTACRHGPRRMHRRARHVRQ